MQFCFLLRPPGHKLATLGLFPHTRKKAAKIFLSLSPPSPSPGQVAKMSTSDKERTPQLLFVKALASRGRLEAITQQMGYHPQYLDSFLRMQHYLLHMDGPLPAATTLQSW